MKKILIVPAAVIAAGLIYTGVHFGTNDNSDTPAKPVVAAAHENKSNKSQPAVDSSATDNSNDSNNDDSSDNSGSLAYNFNLGTPTGNQVASTGNTQSSSSTPIVVGGSGGGSTTPPATTPTPPVDPVAPPVVTTPDNLIANASAEDSTGGVPTSWTQDGYGNNTPFPAGTYLNTGHTGSHSLQVNTTTYTDGDAKWGFTAVPVTAGQSYKFSDFYKSTVATQVNTAFNINGVLTFFYLGATPASSDWSNFTGEFTAPVGATSVVVYHILTGVGSLTTDDYSLTNYTPSGFNRGIVTLNFDDGWLSQYQNAVPVLQANSLTATFFIISDASITNPDPQYMNASQISDLKNQGYEIGNHTETHPDLTTLTTAQVQEQMGGAQTALQNAIGITPTNFAYPFGAFNASTIAIGQQYFASQRSVISGFNTKDTLDLTQLKIEEVDANITVAQVQAWIDQAIAQKTWLILVYHEIDTAAPAGSGDDTYVTNPANLVAELAYLKSTGVAVETTQQAVAEISAQ